MTTMLERAARAAMTVCVGFSEEGDDVYVGSNTADDIARAVLMAVRIKAPADLADQILNEQIDAILEGK